MAEKLTPQQREAVTNRGGKLLVSAAAGSGKTKVLVDRLMSYLTDPVDPANMDSFVIITYTKAAASELRGKIGAKLTELIAENPGNRHLQQQMQRLYMTKISTVHSFCSDILREYAYRLDIAADFRVADESECQELQMRVLEQILDSAYETIAENSDFQAFVDSQGFGRDDRQIPEIVLKVYNSARCQLNPEEWLSWCASSGNAEGLTDAGQTTWGEYLISDLHSYLDMQIEAMKNCALKAARADGMQKPAGLLAATVTQLETLRNCDTWDDIRKHKDIDYGRLVFSKKCSDLSLADQIKEVRSACKKGLEKKLRAFADPSEQVLYDLDRSSAAARGLVALVRQFEKEYGSVKKSRRILDFGDLEHKMLDLLLGKQRSGPTAIAGEIAQRYREIMVDEYQDSNEVQDRIFSVLTQNRQNLFMVGDVKQSIYQFRLADPGIFIEKYNAYSQAETAQPGEGRKVLLSSNFRSSGGVISAVNDVFSSCMSPEVGGLIYGEEEMLHEGIPHIPLEEPEVELYGIQVKADTYAEEAAFTAERICTLLDGKHMVRQGDRLRPIKAEDIVILLRSPGSVGGEFIYALEQRGIRCVAGGSTNLLETEEISTLRALLQVISNPLQDIPLIAVLTSRVFGFTADELARFRSEHPGSCIYDAVRSTDSEKAEAFLTVLSELRQEARMNDLTQLLDKIFTRTRLDSIYAAMPDGAERTSNLQAFCQIASSYEGSGHKDLAQFLEHLDAIAERGLSVAGEQQQAGCVTIMSIHKSKGLEFPVVFLCGLSRAFNQESTRAQVLCDKKLGLGLSCVDVKQRVRYPTIAKRAIAVKMMTESISEEMRVLYVAMTRAKDRLIMTYAVKNLENELHDLVSRMDMSGRRLMTGEVDCPGSWVLQTALRRTEAGAFFSLGGNPANPEVKEPFWHIAVCEANETISEVFEEDTPSEQWNPELIARMKAGLSFAYPHSAATQAPSKQTATQLKGRIKDLEAAEKTKEEKRYIAKFRKPTFEQASTGGKEYGSATHAVMQYIRFEVCKDTESVRQEVARLIGAGLITPEQGALVDCNKIARFFDSELGQKLQRGTNVLREFKFSILDNGEKYVPGMEGEKVLLQGVVDCALIEEDGITVLDFKTDYVTEDTLPKAVERYRGQVLAYGDALQRIYCRKIKSIQLYFFCLDQFAAVQ